MEWLNEPASWQRTGDVLRVSVDPGTDFWRETGYGYIRTTVMSTARCSPGTSTFGADALRVRGPVRPGGRSCSGPTSAPG